MLFAVLVVVIVIVIVVLLLLVHVTCISARDYDGYSNILVSDLLVLFTYA